MAIFHHPGTQLQARLQLARGSLVIGEAQVGITTDLSQLGQSRQNLKLVLLLPGTGRPGRAGHGTIDLPLLRGQLHLADMFHFGRQFLQYLLLQAAEQERLDQTAQLLPGLGVLALGNGPLQLLHKGRVGKQITGHEKVEQIPQFAEPVFNGRPGEHKALAAHNGLYRLGGQGRLVFHILALVQYAGVEAAALI